MSCKMEEDVLQNRKNNTLKRAKKNRIAPSFFLHCSTVPCRASNLKRATKCHRLKSALFAQNFCNDINGYKTCDCLRSIKAFASNWDGRSKKQWKTQSNHIGRLIKWFRHTANKNKLLNEVHRPVDLSA